MHYGYGCLSIKSLTLRFDMFEGTLYTIDLLSGKIIDPEILSITYSKSGDFLNIGKPVWTVHMTESRFKEYAIKTWGQCSNKYFDDIRAYVNYHFISDNFYVYCLSDSPIKLDKYNLS